MPALKPASTGCEMKSATQPSFTTPAMSRMIPASMASVVAAWIACSGGTVATAAPVSAASVEVVETLSARLVPSSA